MSYKLFVFGQKYVGKSTLIEAVFEGERPKDVYEHWEGDNLDKLLEEELTDGQEVWYVIKAPTGELDSIDVETITKLLKHNLKVKIILAQYERANPWEKVKVHSDIATYFGNLNLVVIKVSARPLEMEGKEICKPFGINLLRFSLALKRVY